MVSLNALFFILVFLFAIIGALRGPGKEVLVSFSAILAIFVIVITTTYVPFMKPDSGVSASSRFYIQTLIIVVLVMFGYLTPRFLVPVGERLRRQRFADLILGFMIGALNGYLIVGSIWYYMNVAKYPISLFIPPESGTDMGQAAINLLKWMPPATALLSPPWIYFMVAIAFIIVIMFFI